MRATPSDHYAILDVPHDATAQQIKSAYRFQIKAFHPDKFVPGTDHAVDAQRRIERVTEAYRVLSDARNRAEYDRFLKYTSDDSRIVQPRHPFLEIIRGRWKTATASVVLHSKRKLSIPIWAFAVLAIVIVVVAAGLFIPNDDSQERHATTPAPTFHPKIESPTPFPSASSQPSVVPPASPTESETPRPEVSNDRHDSERDPPGSTEESQESSDESDAELSGPNEKGVWQDLSPDGRLLALSFENADNDGTRVAIFAISNAIENQIAQHFFAQRLIAHAAWSPDSKFLLFTTKDARGHSAWHYAAFVFSLLDKSFHKLDEDIGDVVEPKFDFEAPNKAILTVRTDANSPSDRDVIVPLDKITFTALPPASNSSTEQRSNFVRNGEFSRGVGFWNIGEKASSVADPVDPANEVLSVPIIENIGAFSQNLAIPAHVSKLRVSLRAYCADASSVRPVRIKIGFFDSGGAFRVVGENVFAQKSVWQSITFPVVTLTKEMRDAVGVEIVGPNGALVLFDDFMITEWTADAPRADKSMGDARAALLFKPRIEYPKLARTRRITGSGTYVLSVNPAGNVTSIAVGASSGSPILDGAAIRSLMKCKFRPGSPPRVRIPVTWSLPKT